MRWKATLNDFSPIRIASLQLRSITYAYFIHTCNQINPVCIRLTTRVPRFSDIAVIKIDVFLFLILGSPFFLLHIHYCRGFVVSSPSKLRVNYEQRSQDITSPTCEAAQPTVEVYFHNYLYLGTATISKRWI